MNTLGFQFHYTKIDGLPRLAWVAHFKNDNQSTTVEHGPWVETHPRFSISSALGTGYGFQIPCLSFLLRQKIRWIPRTSITISIS
jgi:hypothetical protein